MYEDNTGQKIMTQKFTKNISCMNDTLISLPHHSYVQTRLNPIRSLSGITGFPRHLFIVCHRHCASHLGLLALTIIMSNFCIVNCSWFWCHFGPNLL